MITTRVDELAFSRALRVQIPNLTFVVANEIDTGPLADSVVDLGKASFVSGVIRSDVERFRRLRALVGTAPVNTQVRKFYLLRSKWEWEQPKMAKWAWDPPTLGAGTLSATYSKANPEEVAFVNLVWKTMRQVMTNRFKVEMPHIGHVIGEVRRPDFWAGHDALRWCREAPNRMLDGKFRPTDDWQFPDLPWYRAIPPRDLLEGLKGKGR